MFAHLTAPAAAQTAPDSAAIWIAILVSGVGALLIATMLADRGGLLPRSTVAFRQWATTIAMTLSLGSAAIHFSVVGQHFSEYPPFGVAFVALAWFQVGWAVGWLLGGRRPFALVAIAVNGGALVVWVASRWIGLPIGPEPGELEPVGPLDLLAAVLELGLIGLLAWDVGVPAPRFRPALPAAGATVAVGSVVLAVVVATSAAFASAGTGPHGEAGHSAPGVEPVGNSGDPGLTVEPSPDDPSRTPGGDAGVSAASPGVPSASPAAVEPGNVTPRPTRAPTKPPTQDPPGPAPSPATPRPTNPPAARPGVIQFGSALDSAGAIAAPNSRFREGETAVWIADFDRAPGVPEILKLIVQILPDGREFEHWREMIPLSDPDATRLVGQAELSLYAHGGVGSYRLRYLNGNELLAEGAFELVD